MIFFSIRTHNSLGNLSLMSRCLVYLHRIEECRLVGRQDQGCLLVMGWISTHERGYFRTVPCMVVCRLTLSYRFIFPVLKLVASPTAWRCCKNGFPKAGHWGDDGAHQSSPNLKCWSQSSVWPFHIWAHMKYFR